MPSYHITYFNVKERKIDEENIFMKTLGEQSDLRFTILLTILTTLKSKT